MGSAGAQILQGHAIVPQFIFPKQQRPTGTALIGALELRDYPTVQAIVLLAAGLVLVTNLIVDLSYAFIDPRIRYG